MKLIRENTNSSHINANGVRGDAVDTIGQLDTLLPLCILDMSNVTLHVLADISSDFILSIVVLNSCGSNLF